MSVTVIIIIIIIIILLYLKQPLELKYIMLLSPDLGDWVSLLVPISKSDSLDN